MKKTEEIKCIIAHAQAGIEMKMAKNHLHLNRPLAGGGDPARA
jgi:hypothetical protein